MNLSSEKCVMIIDETLPLGIIANTAAILGVTLGKTNPDIVGPTIFDKSDKEHLGIITVPIPILKGNSKLIKDIREKLYDPEFEDLTVVDFSDVAQNSNTYEVFQEKMAQMPEESLNYLGIGIMGDKKKVNKLTGCIGLLR